MSSVDNEASRLANLRRAGAIRWIAGKRQFSALALTLVAVIVATSAPPVASAASVPLSIRVQGTELINGAGNQVQLRGVNRDGTEYACVQGWGIFDGPSDAASIAAIKSWHVNVVRIQLNEDCWLGINGVNPAYSGANYRNAIAAYVKLLRNHGLYTILTLTDSAPGKTLSQNAGTQMPDESHAPRVWKQLATRFKSMPSVIFDLFGEPYPDNNTTSTGAWTCWRDGGTCPQLSFKAAGMQQLVSTVRATGATNVIMLGGIGYASVLDQWAAYAPTDPLNQLAASLHDYYFGGCTTSDCWNANLTDIGNVPLITDEMGFAGYIDNYMAWADPLHVSYLAWTWDTWGCDGGQALISDYTGTPCSPYGADYQQHLATVAARAS
jgi:hypothetical protein